jgi:hypothetical protein
MIWGACRQNGEPYALLQYQTPFGHLLLKSVKDRWACIQHPVKDYAFLDIELPLAQAQRYAVEAYERALDRAIKERQ